MLFAGKNTVKSLHIFLLARNQCNSTSLRSALPFRSLTRFYQHDNGSLSLRVVQQHAAVIHRRSCSLCNPGKAVRHCSLPQRKDSGPELRRCFSLSHQVQSKDGLELGVPGKPSNESGSPCKRLSSSEVSATVLPKSPPVKDGHDLLPRIEREARLFSTVTVQSLKVDARGVQKEDDPSQVKDRHWITRSGDQKALKPLVERNAESRRNNEELHRLRRTPESYQRGRTRDLVSENLERKGLSYREGSASANNFPRNVTTLVQSKQRTENIKNGSHAKRLPDIMSSVEGKRMDTIDRAQGLRKLNLAEEAKSPRAHKHEDNERVGKLQTLSSIVSKSKLRQEGNLSKSLKSEPLSFTIHSQPVGESKFSASKIMSSKSKTKQEKVKKFVLISPEKATHFGNKNFPTTKQLSAMFIGRPYVNKRQQSSGKGKKGSKSSKNSGPSPKSNKDLVSKKVPKVKKTKPDVLSALTKGRDGQMREKSSEAAVPKGPTATRSGKISTKQKKVRMNLAIKPVKEVYTIQGKNLKSQRSVSVATPQVGNYSKKTENRKVVFEGMKRWPKDILLPFLEVSMYNNQISFAKTFWERHSHFFPKDVEPYNAMMMIWARKGDGMQVKKLFEEMRLQKVQPDIHTYAAALEAFGRRNPLDVGLARRCLEAMTDSGLSIDQLFKEAVFLNDGKSIVENLLKLVKVEYVPPPQEARPRCEIPLVRDLYETTNGNEFIEQDKPRTSSFTKEKLKASSSRQWQSEMQECVNVKSVEEPGIAPPELVEKRKILTEHKDRWRTNLTKAFLQFMKEDSLHMRRNQPFLSVMPVEDYVELMVDIIPSFCGTSEGISNAGLVKTLGSSVFKKFALRSRRNNGVAEKVQKIYDQYLDEYIQGRHSSSLTHREVWENLQDSMTDGPKVDMKVNHKWKTTIIFNVGSLLQNMMLQEVNIDANMFTKKTERKYIPALYFLYNFQQMKSIGWIKPHPQLTELLVSAKPPVIKMETNLLPMLSPPLPWVSHKFGGFPNGDVKMMRSFEETTPHDQLLESTPLQNLYPVMDSLNQLSAVPWIVNKRILDLVTDVYKKGGSKALDVPQPPSVCQPVPAIAVESSQQEIFSAHCERAHLRKLQAEMHSLRMDMLYKLSIANHFRDDIIWFPHNMDFRGRVYPVPPHFNHMGHDRTRSLLLFAEGKPLGERGLDWMKIHLVNLTGNKKKSSLADRLAYANEMMPEILDSADNPMEGRKWWQGAGECWQALACCMEIANAVRSPDHTKYISHFPVQQDGSCNGLQHYAALGRDMIGAEQVNLMPFDVPQDVYEGVSQMVEESRVEDAKRDIAIAKKIEGLVSRKVVKQTVMTVVYGVTAYGGRTQIFRQLKDLDVLSDYDAQEAAGYLTIKVFESLQKMFTKTREIQEWLTESAWMISKAGSSVEWTSPLGLPIIQPYHKTKPHYVLLTNGRSCIIYVNDGGGKPNTSKQKNAFPPNFIHSLDSTHMMLTSLYCQKAGITFVSVHDCFWTHACDVEKMNEICRQQFVNLHSQPILQDLAKDLIKKHGNKPMPSMKLKRMNSNRLNHIKDYIGQVPQQGQFELKNVLDSVYFFC